MSFRAWVLFLGSVRTNRGRLDSFCGIIGGTVVPNHSVVALPPCLAKTTGFPRGTVAAAVITTGFNSGRTTSLELLNRADKDMGLWNLDPDICILTAWLGQSGNAFLYKHFSYIALVCFMFYCELDCVWV